MNMFIYDENGNLTIRKPNGLEYRFENTDKPELGFEYDVLVYDNIEVKICEWQDGKDFQEQDQVKLSAEECDSIETYIANSEPPSDVNLNQQYLTNLNHECRDYINTQCNDSGFQDFMEVIYAGRDGSNHPYRSDARDIMEYADVVWQTYVKVSDEIKMTREDTLKPYEDYMNAIPGPMRQLFK